MDIKAGDQALAGKGMKRRQALVGVQLREMEPKMRGESMGEGDADRNGDGDGD